jgi:hypothetical protein
LKAVIAFINFLFSDIIQPTLAQAIAQDFDTQLRVIVLLQYFAIGVA